MSDNYKLKYFNIKVLGEPIRFIFHAAGIAFEDIRVDESEWNDMKSDIKWGFLPILEVNGEEIAESGAICRFLATKYGMSGKNDLEAGRVDELVDVLKDIRLQWRKYYFEDDVSRKAAAKQHLQNIVYPYYLPRLDRTIQSNGGTWLVGDSYTWADFFLTTFLEVWEDTIDPKLLDSFPSLQKNKEAVLNLPGIKEYVEGRPKTDI